ncbi:uncharacterized protein LOC127872908 isoform X2 [Dreissena polymorpha]|nr:uncharacterized protein LOC127872908 isoform X2 [Dreissena polymorpha]
METRNRKRRRPSVKLHQHPSQNLPGTSQQPRQLPSTQMPDQLPPNQQPVQLPPNQQPVQLPLTPSHRLGQWSSNQQSGHQPDQLPLSQQLGDQMQPAASQPDPAVQSGYVISSLETPVPWEEGLSGGLSPRPRTGLELTRSDLEAQFRGSGARLADTNTSVWSLGKSPINVVTISKYLQLYPNKEVASVLSNGFKQGFKLGYKGSHLGSSANNLVSTKVHFSEVQKKLDKEISLGRISGPFIVPPISNLKVSPLGILEKPDGGWRLITHLSYPNGSSVNDGFSVEDISVKYTSFDKVADMLFSLGTSAMMAKRDIKSAFRLMPIYPGDFHLMGLQFNNQYYVDKCLPMGLSIAPALFESFSPLLYIG